MRPTPHNTNKLYMDTGRLNVHLGLVASARSSAVAPPGGSPDKGGWGVAGGGE